MHIDVPLRPEEKKTIDFNGKLYLAPLTTVGNLPFRSAQFHIQHQALCKAAAVSVNAVLPIALDRHCPFALDTYSHRVAWQPSYACGAAT